jgi:hypothetical protein
MSAITSHAMNSVIGSLPKHQYVWVDSTFTHKEYQGFVPAVWFGLVSLQGRMWGCNVLFENGAIYRSIPIHALAHEQNPSNLNWEASKAQRWDCYGTGWSTTEYTYLKALECNAKCGDEDHGGEYLFTVAPMGDGFSEYPGQAKEFTFVKLYNGRYTVQPTDYIIFKDRSFTSHNWEFPSCFKRQNDIFSCE